MNFINIVGIIFAITVMLFAMLFGNPQPMKMLNAHGAIIVLGGTMACVGIAFQLPRALSMVRVFFKGILTTSLSRDINKQIIQEMMVMAEAFRNNDPKLAEMIDAVKDPFMKESLTAITDEVLDPSRLLKVLHSRVNTIYERYADDAKMFIACGKYPPAMGLMGAVTGMIFLLGSLGEPGAEKSIGPNMSIALIATLYGIALANLFIIPVGEYLQEIAKRIRTKNFIIVEGIRHIQTRQNPVVLAEELNSFLLPSERVDWKSLGKK
ncbi:MAG: MotA/TolQ/ExbB proton channel family protein [Methylotenera sp.]|nr:MotA/TolQ/ExbB proton channel family protein [Oligoflexia bacterium]